MKAVANRRKIGTNLSFLNVWLHHFCYYTIWTILHNLKWICGIWIFSDLTDRVVNLKPTCCSRKEPRSPVVRLFSNCLESEKIWLTLNFFILFSSYFFHWQLSCMKQPLTLGLFYIWFFLSFYRSLQKYGI